MGGAAYHPVKWATKTEGQNPLLGALLRIKPLLRHCLEEKESRGYLVIVLWYSEPWLSRLDQPGCFRVKVSGRRGHRQGEERSRENLSVVFFKKRKKSSCLSFLREKNYLNWHKIYLRSIFLELLRKIPCIFWQQQNVSLIEFIWGLQWSCCLERSQIVSNLNITGN